MKNKFAIVTGASTGIGRAIAIELGKQSAFITLVARRKNKLDETKKAIEKAGGEAKSFVADLSKITSINQLISKIKRETKKVDILVNVAGIWHGRNEVYADTNFEKFSREVVLDTMMVGITMIYHAFIKAVIADMK